MDALLRDADATLDQWTGHHSSFARWSLEFEYGEIFARDALDERTRQLAIVIMLATAGNRAVALQRHIEAALRAGLTPAELTEAFMHLAIYAGFPTALNAITTATAVCTSEQPGAGASKGVAVSPPESRATRHARGLATLSQTSASGVRSTSTFTFTC